MSIMNNWNLKLKTQHHFRNIKKENLHKILVANLTKFKQDLYKQNYKMLIKLVIKKMKRDYRLIVNIIKMSLLFKLTYRSSV